MKKTLIMSLSILAASSVMADENKLTVLDTDHDGLLSIEEASADPELAKAFADLDIDKDGFISQAEWQAESK